MNFLSKFFSPKYNDDQLVEQAKKAITADPRSSDLSSLLISSRKGMVKLSGIVSKEEEKGRIEENVRTALTSLGLKYEGLINELKMPHR